MSSFLSQGDHLRHLLKVHGEQQHLLDPVSEGQVPPMKALQVPVDELQQVELDVAVENQKVVKNRLPHCP